MRLLRLLGVGRRSPDLRLLLRREGLYTSLIAAWKSQRDQAVRAALARPAAAHTRNPDRFVNKPPTPAALPTAAWINKPPTPTDNSQTTHSINP